MREPPKEYEIVFPEGSLKTKLLWFRTDKAKQIVFTSGKKSYFFDASLDIDVKCDTITLSKAPLEDKKIFLRGMNNEQKNVNNEVSKSCNDSADLSSNE